MARRWRRRNGLRRPLPHRCGPFYFWGMQVQFLLAVPAAAMLLGEWGILSNMHPALQCDKLHLPKPVIWCTAALGWAWDIAQGLKHSPSLPQGETAINSCSSFFCSGRKWSTSQNGSTGDQLRWDLSLFPGKIGKRFGCVVRLCMWGKMSGPRLAKMADN